jgi:hypothetical protein
MSKRTHLTKASGEHSWIKSYLHKVHKAKQQELRKRKKESIILKIPIPEETYPPFKSDVSKLQSGDPLIVERGRLKPLHGKAWLAKLLASEKEFSWIHRWDKSAGKAGGWKSRPLPKSDMRRETIDLRPDHSRVIQYLLESGRRGVVLEAVQAIREKKIELFERIYGRKVMFVAEHDDSGQLHTDLWHYGISDHPEKKAMHEGNEVPLRGCNKFLSYGISVGACSWARHMSAFKDVGLSDEEIRAFAGETMDALDQSIKTATKQNGENPRDLLLQTELDNFVQAQLKNIDPVLSSRTLAEYVTDRKQGYIEGGVGLQRNQLLKLGKHLEVLKGEMAKVTSELESEREAREIAESTLIKVLTHLTRAFRALGKPLLNLFSKNPPAQLEFLQLNEILGTVDVPKTPAEQVAELLKRRTQEIKEREIEMKGPTLPTIR